MRDLSSLLSCVYTILGKLASWLQLRRHLVTIALSWYRKTPSLVDSVLGAPLFLDNYIRQKSPHQANHNLRNRNNPLLGIPVIRCISDNLLNHPSFTPVFVLALQRWKSVSLCLTHPNFERVFWCFLCVANENIRGACQQDQGM